MAKDKKLKKLSKDVQQAKKVRDKKEEKAEHAQKRTAHFKDVAEDAKKGTPKKARAKRKISFWSGVKRRANKAKEQWDKVVNRKRRKKLAYLKKHKPEPATGMVTPDKPWNPSNRQVCGWMVEWLDKSRNAGWSGVVVSGVRTPAYSEQLCYNICGRPSCPGLCAGRNSNHNATTGDYPQGAIDITDYYNFASIQRRIGSPLKNDLPHDRVHFSVSGH
jgi:hypothetical protein